MQVREAYEANVKWTREFIETVTKMREAQKEYFHTRDRNALLKSIGLETKVDKMLKERRNAEIQ